MPHNNRMQSDFGELALASAADARRYVVRTICTDLVANSKEEYYLILLS